MSSPMHHHRFPRVYLIRHGETAWSLSGQHTGKSDIPLTENGRATMAALAPSIVGPGKLLDGPMIQHAFISPRSRAQETFKILFANSVVPEHSTEEGVQEWDYGKYEGLTAAQIREKYDPNWQIWEDGCPEGESAEEMTNRVDAMIAKIRGLGESHVDGKVHGCGDVLIVSHGHFTRCFLTRWCSLTLSQGRLFTSDAGALSICGYQHNSFAEPGLLALNLYGETTRAQVV